MSFAQIFAAMAASSDFDQLVTAVHKLSGKYLSDKSKENRDRLEVAVMLLTMKDIMKDKDPLEAMKDIDDHEKSIIKMKDILN